MAAAGAVSPAAGPPGGRAGWRGAPGSSRREALPNTTAMARGEALYLEVTGRPREDLGLALARFRGALDLQEPESIEACRMELLATIHALRRGRG